MSPPKSTKRLVVVDGSNLATEGRSVPSLAQLSDAVSTYMEDNPDVDVTVVVDATFGHRIDSSEVKEYDAAVSNNELVAPPAGAVGRGDAFVLGIADKANATVLSNDSFQEFHGQYTWLFDPGRLVGGKPVPHVGWVFVERCPVRGPVSRKATGAARATSKAAPKQARRASPLASDPMPIPSAPPPGRAQAPAPRRAKPVAERVATPRTDENVNDLMPFLEFVGHHPVGTSVNATVESYSSHGAYVVFAEGGVRGYVPLRLMADPPPRSARSVMKTDESITVVIVSYAPARRSIDCALPDMAAGALASVEVTADDDGPEQRSTSKSVTKKSVAKKAAPTKTAAKKAAPSKRVAKKTVAKKSAPAKSAAPAKKLPAMNTAPAKKLPAKKSAPAKRAPAKRAPAKQRAGAG